MVIYPTADRDDVPEAHRLLAVQIVMLKRRLQRDLCDAYCVLRLLVRRERCSDWSGRSYGRNEALCRRQPPPPCAWIASRMLIDVNARHTLDIRARLLKRKHAGDSCITSVPRKEALV